MKRRKALSERFSEYLPSFIYLGALAIIIGSSLYFQKRGEGDDLRRTVAFERIADAIERLAPDE